MSLRSCLLHFVSVAFFFWHSVALMRFERFVAMFIYLPSRKVFGFSVGLRVFIPSSSFYRVPERMNTRIYRTFHIFIKHKFDFYFDFNDFRCYCCCLSLLLCFFFFFFNILVCVLLSYVGIPNFLYWTPVPSKNLSSIYLTCFLRRFVTTYINNN